MKRSVILVVALGLFLCSTASAFQGGGGEPTRKKPAAKKQPAGATSVNTTPRKPPASPARPKTPTLASLMVNSNLPNVKVTINGRTAGTTDSNGYLAIGSMKPGVYTVSVSKPGYQPEKVDVTLLGGQSETLNLELKPFTQSLTISSTPPEAEIYIDEVLRGSTDASGNARIADVPVGEHRVTVRKSRYREAIFPLSLASDKEGQINANLELAIGFLTVTTNAPNPTIDISGLGHFDRPVSKVECQPGTYSVTISSPLYVTSRKEVSVSAGQDAQLSVDLEVDSAARSRLTSEALEAYSSKQYDRAISLAKTLLSADYVQPPQAQTSPISLRPTLLTADSNHAQALSVLSQSYFMKDDFYSFTKFGHEAIEAGGSVEISLNHQFSSYYLMHPAKLVLSAKTLAYEPQPSQNMVCEYSAFKVSLAVLGAAEVSGNRDNEIYVQLVFVDPNKPKKPTMLRFRDRESYFAEKGKTTAGGLVSYIGHTIVSRRQAYGAMTAIADLVNRAKALTKAGNQSSLAGTTTPEVILQEGAAETRAQLSNTRASPYRLPTFGQQGRPVEILGPFDGNYINTSVKISGTQVKILSESGEKLVFEAPDSAGPSEITLKEGQVEVRGAYRNVKVNLSAPKTTLFRGESTIVTIMVLGLQGIQHAAMLKLEISGVISFLDVNTGIISIQPQEVDSGGRFELKRTIIGKSNGNFQIKATVLSAP